MSRISSSSSLQLQFRSRSLPTDGTCRLRRDHFSLVVVANPGAEGGHAVHLDSMLGAHCDHVEKLVRRLLSYAPAAIDPSFAVTQDGLSQRFSETNFAFTSAPVPQQPNSFDCAIFALQNLELLLTDLTLIEKLRLGHDATNLYDPSVAFRKREELRALVFNLVGVPDPAAPLAPQGSFQNSSANTKHMMCSSSQPCRLLRRLLQRMKKSGAV
ncbi:hypothetical protein KFL_000340455 [Klebsormidium nitens]|uniref:Ubiquitin-like protease family profile domain-containing protein n=1 Tax=Klebsormidium nitens TaxID=105231 RepID=A0A1Y1HNN4_KLENI|nr:hypothetical protein KFL_000340455 [Klebsormidium nitens]|eukprot:GAQ79643.1 hypothetical protein KFL_000340455 [Klebsormidium nitens]